MWRDVMYVCDVSLSLSMYICIYIHLYHTCICTYCTCTHSVHVNILKIGVFLVTCHLVQTWRSKNKERWNFRLASTSVWPSLLWKKHLVGANVQVILLAWLACLFGLEVQHEAKTRHWVFEAEWVRLRLTWSLEKTAQVVSSLCCQSRGCWVERWSSFISNPLSEYWTRPSPENLYVLSSSDPYWVRIAAIPRNCLFLVMVNIFLNIISTSILNAAPDLTFHGFLDFLKICKYMWCEADAAYWGTWDLVAHPFFLLYLYGRFCTTYCVRLDKLLLSLSWNLTLVVFHRTSREGELLSTVRYLFA